MLRVHEVRFSVALVGVLLFLASGCAPVEAEDLGVDDTVHSPSKDSGETPEDDLTARYWQDNVPHRKRPAPTRFLVSAPPPLILCSAAECGEVCGLHHLGEACQTCLCAEGCGAVIDECTPTGPVAGLHRVL